MLTEIDEIFLSYAKDDASTVRRIHTRLQKDGFRPWLDEHDILPGQAWEQVIAAAIRRSKVFLLFLSRNAVSKAGYIQKEIRQALEAAERLPLGTVFIIPVRLDDCEVPERLNAFQWIDAFRKGWYVKLIASIATRARLHPQKRDRRPLVPIPVFASAAEHALYDLIPRGGECFIGRIPKVGYAVSEGHILVTFKTLPAWLLRLKCRPLLAISKKALFPGGAPWRTDKSLVYKMGTPLGTSSVILASPSSFCGIQLRYWRLALFFALRPSIYISGE